VKDAEFIKQTAMDCFGNEAKIYLFGSRVSDYKKGVILIFILKQKAKMVCLIKR